MDGTLGKDSLCALTATPEGLLERALGTPAPVPGASEIDRPGRAGRSGTEGGGGGSLRGGTSGTGEEGRLASSGAEMRRLETEGAPKGSLLFLVGSGVLSLWFGTGGVGELERGRKAMERRKDGRRRRSALPSSLEPSDGRRGMSDDMDITREDEYVVLQAVELCADGFQVD